MVFAEDPQGLLPLHQGEEIICHCLAVEEVVHTEQEVPEEGGNFVSRSPKRLLKWLIPEVFMLPWDAANRFCLCQPELPPPVWKCLLHSQEWLQLSAPCWDGSQLGFGCGCDGQSLCLFRQHCSTGLCLPPCASQNPPSCAPQNPPPCASQNPTPCDSPNHPLHTSQKTLLGAHF